MRTNVPVLTLGSLSKLGYIDSACVVVAITKTMGNIAAQLVTKNKWNVPAIECDVFNVFEGWIEYYRKKGYIQSNVQSNKDIHKAKEFLHMFVEEIKRSKVLS